MLKSFSTLQPDSIAPSLHRDCDKPFELGLFFVMKRPYKLTPATAPCNKCGLNPKYPGHGLCKKCYFEQLHNKWLSSTVVHRTVDDLPNEMWVDIKEADGYMVSNMGRIKSKNYRKQVVNSEGINEQLLKLREARRNGYLKADLDKYNWRPSVHRLVAIYFIPNPNNYPFVLHKDENKQNNHFENLEWGTRQKNRVDYISHLKSLGLKMRRVPKDTVLEIYKSNDTTQKIASKFNISTTTVWGIKTGRSWSKLTGHKKQINVEIKTT